MWEHFGVQLIHGLIRVPVAEEHRPRNSRRPPDDHFRNTDEHSLRKNFDRQWLAQLSDEFGQSPRSSELSLAQPGTRVIMEDLVKCYERVPVRDAVIIVLTVDQECPGQLEILARADVDVDVHRRAPG